MTGKSKPTVGEELVALRAEIKFGLQEVRTELKGIHEQFKKLNGSVGDVLLWKAVHEQGHATIEAVANARRSVWQNQWGIATGLIGADAGIATALFIGLSTLGVI